MISIQLKDGTRYQTDTLRFVLLGNIEGIDFWHTDKDSKGGHREEIALAKLHSITYSTNMMDELRKEFSHTNEFVTACMKGQIVKLTSEVAEVMEEVGKSLGAITGYTKALYEHAVEEYTSSKPFKQGIITQGGEDLPLSKHSD